MQLTSERYDLEQREITNLINAPRDAAYNRSLCPDCGNPQGMASYDRQAVRWLIQQEADYTFPEEWWVAKSDLCKPTTETRAVYRRCGTCRPMGAPDGWLKVPEEYVQLWAVIPCQCEECTT
jgi:ribosomal protein S14